MAHVELTAHPFPEGITVPRLMPFQELPFNGDGYAAAEVLRLKGKHDLAYAVETGMCLGSTTAWLSANFSKTITCEVNEQYGNIGGARVGKLRGVSIFNVSSTKLTTYRFPDVDGNRCLYFLDAHWGPSCPLLDELKNIAAAKIRPVIMIHDFQVPDRPDLGFDSFPDGRPFSVNVVAPYMDNIYGMDGWTHHFNDQAEGACRGILYVEPT